MIVKSEQTAAVGTISATSAERKETNGPLSQLYSDDPEYQKIFNSWPKGAETNGLVCAVFFDRPIGIKEIPPILYVYVVNTTTNWVHACLNLPREVLFKIKLFDPQGKEVKRTVEGEKFVDWTQKQIEDWYGEQLRVRWSGRGFSLAPLNSTQVKNGISLPDVFQLSQAGEYTFHLQMPLIQVKQDTSGRGSFKTTWLPEVVAKVQIRHEDISSEKSPNVQTNSFVK